MSYRVVMVGEDIYHHGVRGQRWGVRRFQNEDGTLTSAGRKRYASGPRKRRLGGGADTQDYDVERGVVSESRNGVYTKRPISRAEKKAINKIEDLENKGVTGEQFNKALSKFLDKDVEIDYKNAGIMFRGSPGEFTIISIALKGKQEANKVLKDNTHKSMDQVRLQQEMFTGQVQAQQMLQQQTLNQELIRQHMHQQMARMHGFM